MNGYFLNTADSNIIQSSITFESTERVLNRATLIIDDMPLFGFGGNNKERAFKPSPLI